MDSLEGLSKEELLMLLRFRRVRIIPLTEFIL